MLAPSVPSFVHSCSRARHTIRTTFFVWNIRYLDDKKRKNKLKKQGLWEEVQRRERLDEEQAAAGFDGAETAKKAGGRGGGGRRGHGGGGGGIDGGGEGGGENNWGMLGRADDEEGAQFPQKERIRCADFGWMRCSRGTLSRLCCVVRGLSDAVYTVAVQSKTRR